MKLRHGWMMMMVVVVVVVASSVRAAPPDMVEPRWRWSPDLAAQWQRERAWRVGCNFTPSTAINPLEMWQAETFDPATIERELALAEELGFNSVRVFLHHLLWFQDARGFQKRIAQFLKIADRHGIGVMFVLFDGVWDPFPKLGPQRAPTPGVHNSGWVQSPGVELLSDPLRHDELKPYVQGIIARFRFDRRVDAWDLFNEPDNMNRPAYESAEPANKPDLALRLLKKTFVWARECGPKQPLTAGVWLGNWADEDRLSPIERCSLEESDVISFHNYKPLAEARKCVDNLRRYGRPILCTEFMARPVGSTFDPVLGYFKEEKVGGYCWGFVAGKTQTQYPWDSWKLPYPAEPPVWFHDIFRPDGTPFNAREVEWIRALTGKVFRK